MLGKLMKYDIKSMIRVFIPMWIVAPIMALMLSFSIRGAIAWANGSMLGGMLSIGNNILMAIAGILFAGAIIGLLVMTVVFVIQRFWNGLLKEEGYLMFTLPVKVWELIVSKALTATLISCISMVIGVFSGVILGVFSTDDIVYVMASLWEYLLKGFVKTGPVFWMNVIIFILVLIVGTMSSIYHVYAAMSLGHLFATHKVAGSCISYIGISIIVSVIENIIKLFGAYLISDHYYPASYDLLEAISSVYLLYMLLVAVAEVIIYHVITERILSKKLNLE